MAGPELQLKGDGLPPIKPPETALGAAYEGSSDDNRSRRTNTYVQALRRNDKSVVALASPLDSTLLEPFND